MARAIDPGRGSVAAHESDDKLESGRDQVSLSKWFLEVGALGLATEHGFFIRFQSLDPISMSKSTMENISLPALFTQAKRIHSMPASESTIDQETLKEGITAFQRCHEMVRMLGPFSSNESKDDVSTTNLKYLLVPFYLGELTEKISQDDSCSYRILLFDHASLVPGKYRLRSLRDI